ncbi:MAG TPA: hypothetical protein PK728_11120 [Bacillota bacterium]|nr:hypothetical protein [Bacillota bacterium]
MNTSLKEEVLKQLNALPYEQQLRVLDFVRALVTSSPAGVPGKQLLRFAGAIEENDLKIMQQAIESGCEKVDFNEW